MRRLADVELIERHARNTSAIWKLLWGISGGKSRLDSMYDYQFIGRRSISQNSKAIEGLDKVNGDEDPPACYTTFEVSKIQDDLIKFERIHPPSPSIEVGIFFSEFPLQSN
jgi:hypothetical protein